MAPMELEVVAKLVMPGLDPGIHVLTSSGKKDGDGRVEPGHDEKANPFHAIGNKPKSGLHFRSYSQAKAAGSMQPTSPRTSTKEATMPYFLFSVSQKCRISELFVTEKEMWIHVRSNGLCSEVIDREDLEPRRVLYPDYEIHLCDAEGRRIGEAVIRQSPGKG